VFVVRQARKILSLLGAVLALGLYLVPGLRAGSPQSELPAATGADLFRLVMHHPESMKDALRVAFSRLLGNPKKMDLDIEYGSTIERLGGRFRRISVRFEQGSLDALKVSEAHLEALNVHYDLKALLSGKTFMPRSVGSTRLALTVLEEDLNEVVQANRSRLGVSSPEFHFLEDEIRFTGGIRLVFFNNRVDLAGRLKVKNGSEIHFSPSHLHVSRLKVPAFLVRAVSRKFNPVVRLSRAAFWKAFKVHLGEIHVKPGAMEITTDPPPSFESQTDPSLPPLIAQLSGEKNLSREKAVAASAVVPFEAL
jgi:hypothetical protein